MQVSVEVKVRSWVRVTLVVTVRVMVRFSKWVKKEDWDRIRVRVRILRFEKNTSRVT